MNLLRAGPDGVLIELPGLDQVLALAAELRRRAPAGLTEVVPAARTILLVGSGLDALVADLEGWRVPPVAADARPPLEIPVAYDGPDLAEVCAMKGLSRDEVIALHAGPVLTVAFCGFAPGFGYLSGMPKELHVPRRGSPRTQVAAGSVGLAGEFTGVYPRASPGGWQIIGHTRLALWDAARDPPHLLEPGTRVRFVRA